MQEVREGGGRGLGRGGGAAGATAGRKDLNQLGLFIGSLDHVHGSQHLTMSELWTDIHGDEAFLAGGVGTSKDSIFMVFLLHNTPNGRSRIQPPSGAGASPRALGGHGGALRPVEAHQQWRRHDLHVPDLRPHRHPPWHVRALLVPGGAGSASTSTSSGSLRCGFFSFRAMAAATSRQ